MSKLTGRSKKDIFFPPTGLEKDRNNKPVKKLTGENTSEIKKDKSGKEYSLVRHTTENVVKGDTIRPGNAPRVDNFIQGGDYTIIETKPKNFKIKDDYSSMRSMGQAVAKWTSPDSSLLQKGEPLEKVEKRGDEDSLIGKKSTGIKPDFRDVEVNTIQKQEEYEKAIKDKDKKDAANKKKKATETIQTLGSFLKDIGKPNSKVKKAGTTPPKDDRKDPKDKDNKVKKTVADDLGVAQVIKVPK